MLRFFLSASSLLLTACGTDSPPTSRPDAPAAAHPARARLQPAAKAPAADPEVAHADSLRALGPVLARADATLEAEAFKVGDLNADGRPDYLVLARGKKPCAEATAESYCRQVLLVLNQGAAGLRVAATNASLVACSDCGGAGIGDPFQQFVIKGTFFSIETAFGACDKEYITTTFRYNRARRDWLLHRLDTTSASCQDTTGEAGTEEHKTVRDFGTVTFAKYQGEE